jgi:hypothetical protein
MSAWRPSDAVPDHPATPEVEYPEILSLGEMGRRAPKVKPGHQLVLLGDRIYHREAGEWRRLSNVPEPTTKERHGD